MTLYRGDIVTTDFGTRAIVRQVEGGRAKVQLGTDWTWIWAADLHWDGDSLVKVPRTERGWRKLGKLVRAQR